MIAGLPERIEDAANRIYSINRRTPLDFSAYFSKETGAKVHFKLESLQYTGSFKLRGVTNKLLCMSEADRAKGCVTASTGNHGAATAFAMKRLGVRGEIFVPENVNPAKLETIRLMGGGPRTQSPEQGETERQARRYAAEKGLIYISPYNDPDIVAGQGTVGHEILEDLPEAHAVFVCVGGGGLIGGIGAWIKSQAPETKIIGCLPENSPVMLKSIEAGHVVDCDCKPTLSDGSAGNMDHDSITFDLCREVVDDWLLVSEKEIADAMRLYVQKEHMLLEGSAAVALAGFLKQAARWKNQDVVIVICGRNVDSVTLKSIL
jgi:threonine dehydratase